MVDRAEIETIIKRVKEICADALVAAHGDRDWASDIALDRMYAELAPEVGRGPTSNAEAEADPKGDSEATFYFCVIDHDPATLADAVAVLVDALGITADEAVIAIHAGLTLGGKVTKAQLYSIAARLEACGCEVLDAKFTRDPRGVPRST